MFSQTLQPWKSGARIHRVSDRNNSRQHTRCGRPNALASKSGQTNAASHSLLYGWLAPVHTLSNLKKALYLGVLVQGRSRVLARGARHVGYCGLAQVLLWATEQVLATPVGHRRA
jgi:hypothetical protein